MNRQSASNFMEEKMSRKVTKEDFLKRLNKDAFFNLEIIKYDSIKKPCSIKCNICGKIITKERAEYFLGTKSFCCQTKNKKVIELVKELYKEKDDYEIIKQDSNPKYFIVRHNKCGNEMKRTAQDILKNPYHCNVCDAADIKLRLSFEEAKKKLEDKFGNDIKLLHYEGVSSKKDQFQCNRCKLIFNKDLETLIEKTRGCPRCDMRYSKGERAMKKWLEDHNKTYKEQLRFDDLPRLFFDFGVFDGNKLLYLIEVQGAFHFKEILISDKRQNVFERQQENDNKKREWCRKKQIPLYEIINEDGKLLNLDILPN